MNVMPKKAISDLFPTPDDVSWSHHYLQENRWDFLKEKRIKSFNDSIQWLFWLKYHFPIPWIESFPLDATLKKLIRFHYTFHPVLPFTQISGKNMAGKFSKFNREFSPKFHANLAFIDGKSKAPNQQKSRSNVRHQRKNSCHKRFRDSFLLSIFFPFAIQFLSNFCLLSIPLIFRSKRHEIAANAKVKNDSHEDKPKIGPQIS